MQRGGSIGAWWWSGRLWLLAALLAAGAAIAWLSQPRPPEEAVERIAVATRASSEGAPREPAATVDEENAPLPIEPARPSGSELIEVCGVGWVEADADGRWDARELSGRADVAASQRALVDSLRSNDGELGAAIALALERHVALREAGASAPVEALRCGEPQCRAAAEERARANDLLERLAKQATATNDGRVYALALRECDLAPAQGSCTLLSAEQWARLDDGNAAPWLHVLARALRSDDAPAVQEALYRIGAAARHEERPFLGPGAVADHAGTGDVDLIAAVLLAVDALVIAPTPYAPLMAVCTNAPLADANRRQACDRAAATLAERSDSLPAVVMGATLGRRLGWADERIDALRGLEFARTAMVGDSELGNDGAHALPQSCGGARRLLAMLARQGRAGELQPIRDWLAASGKSIAPYAQQAHEMLRRREDAAARDAAAAAASAAAASSGALSSSGVSVAQGAAAIPYSEAPPPVR